MARIALRRGFLTDSAGIPSLHVVDVLSAKIKRSQLTKKRREIEVDTGKEQNDEQKKEDGKEYRKPRRIHDRKQVWR